MVEDRFGRARKAAKKEKTGSSYTGSSRGGFTETKQVGDQYKADKATVGEKEAQQRFMDRGRSQYQDVTTDGGISTLVDPTKVTEDKKEVVPKKEQVKYYDDKLGAISERDLKWWEKKLKAKANKKGFKGNKADAYIYGTMRKTGWKPKKEKT